MKTILLKVDDDILDKVVWLLKSLSIINEVQLIDDCEYLEENKINRLVGVYVFYNISNFKSYPFL